MDKILLLLLGLLLIFMFISFNQECKFVENRVNDNIDKKEDFASRDPILYNFAPITCPVCQELVGGLCEQKWCAPGKTCERKDRKKFLSHIKAGVCG
jgi:hypothetical protein